MRLIEVPSSIVRPFPTPVIRSEVVEWLDVNSSKNWWLAPNDGLPCADHANGLADRTDAALFQLWWLRPLVLRFRDFTIVESRSHHDPAKPRISAYHRMESIT